MTKRAMIALAASAALVPGALSAQVMHHGGSGSGAHAGANANIPAAHAGARVRHGPGLRAGHPGMPGRGHHRQFTRIHRGGMIPGFWFGPQFHVQNWGLYGFSQPSDGGRWVRYYDDAYLVDRDGRVRDGRYGMDWDRYGERWDYDDNGIPAYVGDGDYQTSDWDYEWADRWHRGEIDRDQYARGDRGRDDYARRDHERDDYGRDEHARRRHGPPPPGYVPPPPPPPGYGQGGYGGYGGYGYGYGYGWGWGPVIITETTVTTAPVVETRTYYETVTVRPRKVRRCRCAAPPPPRPGERG